MVVDNEIFKKEWFVHNETLTSEYFIVTSQLSIPKLIVRSAYNTIKVILPLPYISSPILTKIMLIFGQQASQAIAISFFSSKKPKTVCYRALNLFGQNDIKEIFGIATEDTVTVTVTEYKEKFQLSQYIVLTRNTIITLTRNTFANVKYGFYVNYINEWKSTVHGRAWKKSKDESELINVNVN